LIQSCNGLSKCEFSFQQSLPQLKCLNDRGTIDSIDNFFSSVQVRIQCHAFRNASNYNSFLLCSEKYNNNNYNNLKDNQLDAIDIGRKEII
jgi:hypothetical protein